MEVKTYIQNLLRLKGIEVNLNRTNILEEFANSESNAELVKSILENQSKIMMNWNVKNRIADIEAQHIVVPNAKELVPYSAKIDFEALKLTDLVDKKVEGLEELGLIFNNSIDTIEGTPTKSGDVKFKLLFKIKGEDESAPLNEKLISLVINPDPKSLWKSIPSDQEAIFAKPDNITAFEKLGEKNIIVSSKRGRSHANKGTARDDDFAFKYLDKTQWSLVVVSDGAGSAYLAREGSKIACDVVVKYFEQNTDSEKTKEFEAKVLDYNIDKSEDNLKAIEKISQEILYGAIYSVHNKLKEFAEKSFISNPELFDNPRANTNLEYFHSTLIFTLFKKYEFGYLLQSFSVGDCPIAVMNIEKSETTLLNWLDVGEHGGGTRFITQPDIFTSKERPISTRYSLKIIEDFSFLFLMTDGIYDAKFVVEANLEKHEKWIEFLEDLDGKNESGDRVELNNDNGEIANQLSQWMDFWSAGNHDDRTLVIVF
jgi:serine/threonine protein phosphatase PrpC